MTIYYVSKETFASDSNSGLSPSLPWLTLSKVNGSTFAAGDMVKLRRGDTWRETLTVPSSGTSANPLLFTNYGTGPIPAIYGSDVAGAWTNEVVSPSDLLVESFNAAGYDSPTWTPTVGTSCSVDPDSTAVADSQGGATQILATVCASTGFIAWTLRDLGADNPISYTNVRIYVAAEGLANTQEIRVFNMRDTATNTVASIYLRQDGSGNLCYHPFVFTSGALTGLAVSGTIVTGAWNTISIKYDKTNLAYDFRLNGVSWVSGALVAAVSNGIRTIRVGEDGFDGFTATVYFDRISISTGTFSETSVNCYWETLSADPIAVWFVKLDGTIQWGNKKATKGALSVEFDWWWDSGNNRLYVVAATSPAVRYAAVEAGARDYGINFNSKNFLVFDGLEVRYVRVSGTLDTVAGSTLTGLTMQNCALSYIGAISTNAVPTVAYGIISNHSSTLLQFNTISEVGRRGITCHINGGSTAVVDGWVAQFNTIYNCYHSAIDIQFHVSTATCTNITIAYNRSYLDTTRNEVTTGTPFGQLSVEGDVSSQITNVTIHHNILQGTSDKSLSFLYTSNFSVYNNTFYGNNPFQTVAGSHISIDSHCAGTNKIKNNIFYNNAVRSVCTFDDVFVVGAVRITEMDYNLHWCTDAAQWIYDDFSASPFTMAQFAAYKAATGFDATSPVPANPQFDGAANVNLRFTSPAKDAGLVIGGITTNFVGTAPDLGAVEYPAGGGGGSVGVHRGRGRSDFPAPENQEMAVYVEAQLLPSGDLRRPL